MKKVILLVLFLPVVASGQIVENFEQGNTANWVQSTEGRWKADATGSLSGIYSLHHVFDNPDAGTDQIGIAISSLHPSEGSTRWSFTLKHGYDPSSLNNWSVFLMSDRSPEGISPDGNISGFAIGVNLTGSDDTLRLWKVKSGKLTMLVNSGVNWQTDIGITGAATITVLRSKEGNWSVSVLHSDGSFLAEASATDGELFSAGWFGICYRYSATRDRLLWVDDVAIEGVFYEDNEPPVITSCEASGKYSVDLTLSEEPTGEVMLPEEYSLNGETDKAATVTRITGLTYRIVFSKMLINKSFNTLNINSLCDGSGNCTGNIAMRFLAFWPETGDVLITEIMADPTPEVSLPGKEYLEIFNRTGYIFNLKNWKLSTVDQDYLLPERCIGPGEFRIVCLDKDTSLFVKYGSVTGIKQFPTLTDAGRIIWLSDSTGAMVHGVEYSSKWYCDDLKSRGGWSLEMIDTEFPFSGDGNWKACLSKTGGTPGSVNSVAESNRDISFYGIRNVYPDDSLKLRIRFSEPVFNLQQKAEKITISDNRVKSISLSDPLSREFTLDLEHPLQRGAVYEIEVPKEVSDFAGNKLQRASFCFGLPQQSSPGDILFNELLFNPWPGDPDYIELYNCSDKIIDVSRLQLNSINDATGDLSETYFVSEEKRCILPGTYYAVSTDIKKVLERYFTSGEDNLIETGSLPSMPDDKGHLILSDRELNRIDEVTYSEKMHFALLSSFEGVALEKIMPQDKSQEQDKWHSASESSGWGTPGVQNSVFVEMPASAANIVFSSSKITPDDDGYQDFLTIQLNLKSNTSVVSVTIFDEAGNLIRKIVTNLYAGAEASVIWDGTAEDGSLVRTGIYIVLITAYNDTGKTDKWKKVCTVIRKQ